jgi:hypothetical protein
MPPKPDTDGIICHGWGHSSTAQASMAALVMLTLSACRHSKRLASMPPSAYPLNAAAIREVLI